MHKELSPMMEQISDLTVFINHYLLTFIVCAFYKQKMERGLVWLARHFAFGRRECFQNVHVYTCSM